MLQPVEGQLPTGIPKSDVSIVESLFDNELGIWERWRVRVGMSRNPNRVNYQPRKTIY